MERGLFKTTSLELKRWARHPEKPNPVGRSRYRLGTPGNRVTIILTDRTIQAAGAYAFGSKRLKVVKVVDRHARYITINLPSGASRDSKQEFLEVLEDAAKFKE